MQEGSLAKQPPLERAPRIFRRHFAQHNRQALLLAALSVIATVLVWIVIYGVVYWLFLLAATVNQSVGKDSSLDVIGSPAQLLGAHFTSIFVFAALGWVALTAVIRWKTAGHPWRADRNLLLGGLVDLLLLPPNLALAIWGNLRALLFLNQYEMAQAWQLLRQVCQRREDGLPMASVGLEIGGTEKQQMRIVFAMQLAGLISTRQHDDGWTLVLEGDAARALCPKPAPPASDEAAGVEEASADDAE